MSIEERLVELDSIMERAIRKSLNYGVAVGFSFGLLSGGAVVGAVVLLLL